ncbi:MAG: ThiF family adenylyltransferase [Eubacteriales bacterium]|nr:ThiF family adenylyltransferase [Eubacteriales bacterium]
MDEKTIRTRALIGEEGTSRLNASHVLLFGLGGVGGYTAEALLRAGVGRLTVCDFDVVSLSNCNRQLLATLDTVGRLKTEVFRARAASVFPETEVTALSERFTAATSLDFSAFDFVADAVDDVAAKTEIICRARAAGTPVVSCMGTGNKLDATRLRLADISRTHTCPLAKKMRLELRRRGVEKGVTVVFSDEEPRVRRTPPASISYVPAAAGLLMAQHILTSLLAASPPALRKE